MKFLIFSFLVFFLFFTAAVGCNSAEEIVKEEVDEVIENHDEELLEEEIEEEIEEEVFIEIEETLIKVESNPEKGFHWDYYLFVPKMIISEKEEIYLLVGPNNTAIGGSDSMKVHDESAYQEATDSQSSFNNLVSQGLGVPLLVPVFPRPYSEWWVYTQILDRNTMLMEREELKRIDLQLIAMIEDSKKILTEEIGINMKDQIFMNGFSASGGFSHRFAALHPHLVKAVASGGFSMPIFPIEELDGKKLRYPIGISDFNEITNNDFNYEDYLQVHQYIYRGTEDHNDPLKNRDEFDGEDRRLVLELFGEHPLERYKKAEIIYEELGLENVTFKFYRGKGHSPDRMILNDVIAFFKESGGL